MWIGRKYKCIYGLNCDDVVEVTSEPYSIDRKGTKAVSVMSEDNGEEQIEIEELEHSIYWKRMKKE